MQLGIDLEGYICGTDILQDYNCNIYKNLFGNDLYNKLFASTRALGRLVLDCSLLLSANSLANGNENMAGIAAIAAGGSVLADFAIKASRNPVIIYKMMSSDSD